MAKKNHDGDIAFVEALAQVLSAHDLTELEVIREYGDEETLNIRVAKKAETQHVVQTMAAPASPAAAAPAAQAAAPAAQAAPSGGGDGGGDPAQHPGAVTSPMVGTAYLQPEPGAPSFVALGDQVSEGQTVCIVEAMKTMNQIHAPKAGKVTRILIEDGSPVEFGAPLLIIE